MTAETTAVDPRWVARRHHPIVVLWFGPLVVLGLRVTTVIPNNLFSKILQDKFTRAIPLCQIYWVLIREINSISNCSLVVNHDAAVNTQLGAIGFDAVKHLLLCWIERKPRA